MSERLYSSINPDQLDFLSTESADPLSHPVLANLITDLKTPIDDIGIIRYGIVEFSKELSEQRKLEIEGNDNRGYQVAAAATAIYLESGDDVQTIDFARQLLSKHVDKKVIDHYKFDEHLSSSMIAIIDSKNKMDSLSDKIIPVLFDLIDGDSYFGYRIVKALAEPLRFIKPEKGEVLSTGQLLATLAAIDHHRKGLDRQSLINKVLSDLEAGRYDSLLADEMLGTIQADENGLSSQSRRTNLHNMLGLIMAGGADTHEAARLISTPLGIENWGTRMASVLKGYKQDYANSIITALNGRTNVLALSQVVLPENGTRRFDIEMIALIKRLRFFYKHAVGSSNERFSSAELVALQAEERRLNRGYNGSPINSANQSRGVENNPLLRERPRELGFINGQGATYQVVEGETADCVLDYVKAHGGNPDLITEINDLIETLQLVDLSKQINKGVMPHDKNVKINGVNIGTLWQVRPDKIISSTVHLSGPAKKLRIFCVLDDEHLSIHKLVDKKDVHTYKRGLGIQGAVRGNK